MKANAVLGKDFMLFVGGKALALATHKVKIPAFGRKKTLKNCLGTVQVKTYSVQTIK